MSKVVIMDHPLIQHKIGFIRRTDTGTKDFRETISEIAMLLTYEATRDIALQDVEKLQAVAIMVKDKDPEELQKEVSKADKCRLTEDFQN